ncbi:MAG TPA: hypothetical protein VGO31_00550 [Microbacteriaceae bacterium]|nr:hypothetical protein [Microbacteriaceae bacterium]
MHPPGEAFIALDVKPVVREILRPSADDIHDVASHDTTLWLASSEVRLSSTLYERYACSIQPPNTQAGSC